MRLIIGGIGQGKYDYAIQNYKNDNHTIINNYQEKVKIQLKEGKDPLDEAKKLFENNNEIIVICDEVGCGLVPIDPFERLWRDTVGKVCCYFAKVSVSVERVYCSIPTKIK